MVAWKLLISFGAYAVIVDHRSLPFFRVEWQLKGDKMKHLDYRVGTGSAVVGDRHKASDAMPPCAD
jgi:hypothetical protein